MRPIDSAMAAVMLQCSVRQVQTLVAEGKLTNYGARHRIVLDLDEVADGRMTLTPPRRRQPSGGTTD